MTQEMQIVEPEEISLSKKLIKTVFAEAIRGKSLYRTLMNYCLSEFELEGDIIDLGTGSEQASYYRFIKFKKPYNVTYTDYYRTGANLVKLDLEAPFPFERGSFDRVMCFNVLEHVYRFENVVKESYRILKKGGLFVGSAPFRYIYHPDPHDYFRYSHESLQRMFEEAGYICSRMIYIGLGPFSSSIAQWAVPLPKLLKPWPVLVGIFFDEVCKKLSRRSRVKHHQLGYVFVFEKSSD